MSVPVQMASFFSIFGTKVSGVENTQRSQIQRPLALDDMPGRVESMFAHATVQERWLASVTGLLHGSLAGTPCEHPKHHSVGRASVSLIE
jgi:hypothetical protein